VSSWLFASANYTYGSSSHKHAVTALSTGESYSYDANGNTLAPGASAGVTTRVEGGITYAQTFRQAQCGAFDADCEASPKGRTA